MKCWILLGILCLLPMPVCAEIPEISAKSAVVLEYQTGQVLYAKEADKRLPMASTTKIMTALLALENGECTDQVTISQNAAKTEGSSMYLKPGQSLSMETLLYGLMLSSGNDAAVAIAEHIAGSEAAFAEKMTERAREMGCTNTQFKNANGLPDDAHFTTALELARIAGKAMENPKFREIVGLKYAKREGHSFSNHNKMLSLYEGATGIKTGYTKASGRTLVSSAKRGGVELIAVTLNAPDDWDDHEKLLNHGFSQISLCTVAEKDALCSVEPVSGSTMREVKLSFCETFALPVTNGKQVETKLFVDLPLCAPLNAGQAAGRVDVFLEGVKMGEIPVCVAEDVPALPPPAFGKIFEEILCRWAELISGRRG